MVKRWKILGFGEREVAYSFTSRNLLKSHAAWPALLLDRQLEVGVDVLRLHRLACARVHFDGLLLRPFEPAGRLAGLDRLDRLPDVGLDRFRGRLATAMSGRSRGRLA